MRSDRQTEREKHPVQSMQSGVFNPGRRIERQIFAPARIVANFGKAGREKKILVHVYVFESDLLAKLKRSPGREGNVKSKISSHKSSPIAKTHLCNNLSYTGNLSLL